MHSDFIIPRPNLGRIVFCWLVLPHSVDNPEAIRYFIQVMIFSTASEISKISRFDRDGGHSNDDSKHDFMETFSTSTSSDDTKEERGASTDQSKSSNDSEKDNDPYNALSSASNSTFSFPSCTTNGAYKSLSIFRRVSTMMPVSRTCTVSSSGISSGECRP